VVSTLADQLRRLWAHSVWSDAAIAAAINGPPPPSPDAVREYAHVLGAEEIWLARLEGRSTTLAVWPDESSEVLATAARRIHQGYEKYLAGLRDEDLATLVAYTNTAGRAFETSVVDIVTHVALHGQYHRGKVNLLLRQSGATPAPVDYIGFVRGVPAATTRVTR